jgi:hypothetical protein
MTKLAFCVTHCSDLREEIVKSERHEWKAAPCA